MSFTEKLDPASLEAFSVACKKPFSEQAQFFLNAFWDEYGETDAEAIYSISWDIMKKADMRWRNVKYVHLYDEGNDLDFDMGLYFFEMLVKYFHGDFTDKLLPADGKAQAKLYPKSIPEDMTAIVRKKELREKVDVNFDGRVSFLEYLLYQYKASPKDLMDRQAPKGEELPPEVLAAMRALEEVNKRVRAYEAEKSRLEEESELPGIKGLKAKNELAQLNSSPLWEQLNKALITAEAAVRIASRKYGVKPGGGQQTAGGGVIRTNGTMWWLERELRAKKEKYGGRDLKGV